MKRRVKNIKKTISLVIVFTFTFFITGGAMPLKAQQISGGDQKQQGVSVTASSEDGGNGVAQAGTAQVDGNAAGTDKSQAGAYAGSVSLNRNKPQMPQAGNVTVNFKDVDINTVLRYLSEVSGVDIVPSPGVEGTVTMRLRNKPWELALDIVTRNYGYAYSREGDIIRVIPKSQMNAEAPVTEVIPLHHLMRDIELVKPDQTNTGGAGESDVAVQENKTTMNQIIDAINAVLDKKRGERATYISSANAIVLTAIPTRIADIKKMVAQLDQKVPQILLDAKVIELKLNKDERMGVDWNAIISAAGARRPITFPFTNTGIFSFLPSQQRMYYPQTTEDGTSFTGLSNFPPVDTMSDVGQRINPTTYTTADNAANLFSFGTLDFSTFTATLALLNQRDGTEILSCPRITTLDNQKATIKVVDKIMLQKTEQTTQTAGIVTVEFEPENQAREVGVKLTIMPHVNPEGDITVNLMPEVSTNSGFNLLSVGTNSTATISLTFNSREANTRVRVKDGETIFIGGLIRENNVTEDHKLPILGDMFGNVPYLGKMFKYESENKEKTEIVFFVTVHLLKNAKSSFRKSGTVEYLNHYGGLNGEDLITADNSKNHPADNNFIEKAVASDKKDTVTAHVNARAVKPARIYKPLFDFRHKKS